MSELPKRFLASNRVNYIASTSAFAVLLILVSWGVFSKTRRAIAPPIYDPVGYIQKAQAIYRSLIAGPIVNPLNTDPTVRPPGFVPFSYPLGYSRDVNSYLFWTTFSPIVLWLLALYLAFRAKAHTTPDYWFMFSISAGLASLPMFYHFETNTAVEAIDLRWGMQDCLLAGLSALSVSLVVSGAQKRKIGTTVIGCFVSAYTVLIKPAGLVIMLIVAGIWFIEVLISRGSNVQRPMKHRLSTYASVTGISGFAIYSIILGCCFLSKYLSGPNIAFASNAGRTLRVLYSDESWMRMAITYIRPTVGWEWFVPLFLLFIVGLVHAVVRTIQHGFLGSQLRMFSVLVILLGSGVWWIGIAGMQARYFFPFVLLVIVWLVPETLPLARRLPKTARVLIAAYCLGISASLIALLLLKHPPVPMQQEFGYNLSTGGYKEEVEIAHRMIAATRVTGKPMIVYSNMGWRVGVIYSVDYLVFIDTGQPFAFQWVGPVDWIRDPGIRFSDLMKADHFIEEKRLPGNLPDSSKVDSFAQECQAYNIWLESLRNNDGVEEEGNGNLVVFKVTDKEKLAKSFQRFAARFIWRDKFVKNNPELFYGK